MSDTLKYQRGTPLVFTAGEYSDFRTCGYLVTIKDCDLPALAQAYCAEAKAKDGGWYTDLGDFASWLVAQGHAMPMAVQEVHLGAYGTFETEFGVPTDDC